MNRLLALLQEFYMIGPTFERTRKIEPKPNTQPVLGLPLGFLKRHDVSVSKYKNEISEI
jgi:hypothetical protein